MADQSPLVVFSHLPWNYVYQRPQHLLSRLAAFRRVIFIEEPHHDPGAAPRWERSDPARNVRTYRAHVPEIGAAFGDIQHPFLMRLLPEVLEAEKLDEYVLWFYTPMAVRLAREAGLKPLAVVYDCMDNLASFRGAPPQLLQREAELMAWADLVFTGGPSLYRAQQGKHPHLYLFPSSVEAEHFRHASPTAADPVAEATDQTQLPHPRLGYFGVIDERLDLQLLDNLAAAHPEWQLIMIGPVAKIDESLLPRHPNVHYLGPRPYAELPAYLTGWDVCLLPFARNAATRFISPTKTLEYMAAERMIVSTPITDVAEPYGDIVYLGDATEGFIHACVRALQASSSERARRVQKMRQVLARTSWNHTARGMELLIDQAVERRQAASATAVRGTRLRQAASQDATPAA